MKKAILCVSCLILNFLSGILPAQNLAPPIEWENTISGNLVDKLNSVTPTSDGGFILGGTSNSLIAHDKIEFTQGYYDYWIVKLDADGLIESQNTIGGNFIDELQSVE